MKIRFALATLLVAGSAVFGAEPAIEFRGVMLGVGAAKLSLVDKSNDTTRWVEVGQSFAGFKVMAYDPATETATLTQDGKEVRLRLSSSKIPEAPSELPEAVVTAIRNNLRMIVGAADQYFMEKAKSEVRLEELLGPDKYIKQLKPVAGEDYTTLELTPREIFEVPQFLSVTTRSGHEVKFEYPAIPPFVHKLPSDSTLISAGDTVAKIAARWQLTVPQLQALNPEVQWSQLKVGQIVKVK